MGDPPTESWQWDPTLYRGSAGHYVRGRVPYPTGLIDLLVEELGLDGRGRLLDIGCGPGTLTLPLAGHVEHVVGADADAGMLAEARRRASAVGIRNATWLNRRAEDLSPDLGRFGAVTMAQSFHWMDRRRVAALLHQLVQPGGALGYVHATTHEGIDGTLPLANPRPPRREMDALIATYLGPRRRAGRGHRPLDRLSEEDRHRTEAAMFTAAGWSGPTSHVVPGWTVDRTADEVVASVFSLSYATPHLFGDRLADFERELRAMLRRASPDGLFSEQMREIAVQVWRR
jgi:SAM-dependent methyltransferase